MSMLAHIRKEQTQIWSDQISLPYESAFGRLQKFAWANVMDARQIGQDIFLKRALPARPESWELFWGSWINAPAEFPDGLTLNDGLAGPPAQNWMSLLCRTDILRFCPRCLEDGFHSLYHQIEGLEMCPRHFEPLRLTCAHCQATVPLSLCKASFAGPFCCPKCQRPLGELLDPRRWKASSELVSSIAQAFKPIEAWLSKLHEFQVDAGTAPLAQLSMAGEFADELDTVVSCSIANHFAPVPLPSRLWRKSRRPLQFQELAVLAEQAQVHSLKVHGIEMDTFKKVGDEVKKTILQGHEECLDHARSGIWLREDFGREVTQQDGGLCPVAAGYARWRARTWVQADKDRRFYRKMRESVELPPEFVPQKLLAQFYSSVATAYVYELLYREGHRLETTIGSPLRKLLQRYSFGTEDPDAYWVVDAPSGNGRGKWIVMGAPSLFGVMHKLHTESLEDGPERRPLAAIALDEVKFELSI